MNVSLARLGLDANGFHLNRTMLTRRRSQNSASCSRETKNAVLSFVKSLAAMSLRWQQPGDRLLRSRASSGRC